jgi:hypothetical protein
MTGFSADWLALREPFDACARATAWPMLGPLADAVRTAASLPASAPLRVLDLACGSGANLRALAPRLGGAQHWHIVDHDPALLGAVPQAMARWADDHDGYRLDTSRPDDAGLRIEGPGFSAEWVTDCADLGNGPAGTSIGQAHLVTTSALLDLVSANWVENLVRQASGTGAAVLCALTVDGRIAWDPPDATDAAVQQLFALHQLRDKGFGPALGSSAAAHAASCLTAAGYTVVQARSDWVIDAGNGQPQSAAMLTAMISGMASAATAQQPDAAAMLQAWQTRRVALIDHTQLRVGHIDLMAVPARRPDPDPTSGRAPSGKP